MIKELLFNSLVEDDTYIIMHNVDIVCLHLFKYEFNYNFSYTCTNTLLYK